ncbi:hypothetical protein [Buttiauxella warmboldiae]|nr:hypothetical protein [Buttiauxella warmboldiae]
MSLKKLIITDKSSVYVEVVNYGARLHHLGKHAGHNVVVSPAKVAHYLSDKNWMGATIGPRAHLLRDGLFQRHGEKFYYDRNFQGHHLHGGRNGFHCHYWQVEKHTDNVLQLGLTLKESGRFTIQYRISKNTLSITYQAKVATPTLINITNHAYFNLSTEDRIYQHCIKIDSPAVVETDDKNLPLPTSSLVADSILDLQKPRSLNSLANININSELQKTQGYNHCYLLNKNSATAAEISHPDVNWRLQIKTSRPAIHLFTANNHRALLKTKPWRHSSLCLEPVYPISDYLLGDAALSLTHPQRDYCETDSYQFIAF